MRLDRTREGILVDLSENGALLQLPVAPPLEGRHAVQIEWKYTMVALQARVVRSNQRCVQLEFATLARMEYSVGLEFLDLTRETSAAIRRIVQSN